MRLSGSMRDMVIQDRQSGGTLLDPHRYPTFTLFGPVPCNFEGVSSNKGSTSFYVEKSALELLFTNS